MANETGQKQILTTGQLRTLLANSAQSVAQGEMDIERANALHKLAKNITESLYSETKISMFQHEVGQTMAAMGELLLGEQKTAKK